MKNFDFLKERFGERVNFDPVERRLYGHDIAALPALIKPFIGDTTPWAIVQPKDEEELLWVLEWANRKGIPLVPRGKATSGYGGVIPLKKGIVVDFWRMKEVLEIDTANMSVRVQPGITWEELDKVLDKYGLTLRLYPTSYPSATVGGWVAQGGAGIGSFEYGYLKENLLSVRIALPDGTTKELKDEDLDLVYGTQGTTGLLTEVTLKVKEKEALGLMAFACQDAHRMQELLQEIVERDLPFWSVTFINPRMAELKNRAPRAEHRYHKDRRSLFLPAAYVVTLAYERSKTEKAKEVLEILERHAAQLLPQELAEQEWEGRFRLMLVKRLGPSLIPAEVVVPLDSLGKVMEDIEQKVRQPLVKEGVIIKRGRGGKPEAVILGFIPADERKAFSYNLLFALALSMVKVAKRHGGRPYSAGIYFVKEANEVFGEETFKRIKAFKAQIDPKGILNPGKTLSSRIGFLVSLGLRIEPILRPLANALANELGERPGESPIKGIPPEVAWYAYACSQCGYCVEECDQFYSRGWESQSPRGKWYWLREFLRGRAKWDQKMVDTFLVCTTCGLCNYRCSAFLPIEDSWMKLRGVLINEQKHMTFPPFEVMAQSLLKEGNIWAGPREKRKDWFPKELWGKHGPDHKAPYVYFAGCTASYVEKDIAIASVKLLEEAGVDFSYLGEKENCCGTPMLVAGKWDVFEEIMKKNIEAVNQKEAKWVITSCPACDMMWRHYYPIWAQKLGLNYEIKTIHYTELLAKKIKDGQMDLSNLEAKNLKLTFHDSCHIGRISGIYDEPRLLLKSIPGVELKEMPYNREEAHCCGSVLTLIKEPEVAARIGGKRLKEALEVGAEEVVALCPCCEFQFRVAAQKLNLPIKVVDLAHFVSSRFGHCLPDPTQQVLDQWAVFEAMIRLMTPQGFADLLGSMWDELLRAMPLGLGKVMEAMGRFPFLLALVKPMFPVLFPKLLPVVMPKVFPSMLERIRERIPMPDYMAAMMPEIMPKVMEELMPHMVRDVVRLASPSLIGHLKKKRQI